MAPRLSGFLAAEQRLATDGIDMPAGPSTRARRSLAPRQKEGNHQQTCQNKANTAKNAIKCVETSQNE
eukprot:9220699-Lingulodinium_polyedra.AAC.1